jgi:hypothetical protein
MTNIYYLKNFVHTDTIGSKTFIEWKTTGPLNIITVQTEDNDLDDVNAETETVHPDLN